MGDKAFGEPYRLLGSKLKVARERVHESLAEVSGAVEIDIKQLEQIEKGQERPSEDVLLLLISHLGLKDEEATSLWELARYTDKTHGSNQEDKMTTVLMPADANIVYTDMVHVMVNNYGVVINFLQGAGPKSQPVAVARVGMSKEHAQSVLEVLQQTLDQAGQSPKNKALPPPSSKKDDKKQR